jgi:hypothetical protein
MYHKKNHCALGSTIVYDYWKHRYDAVVDLHTMLQYLRHVTGRGNATRMLVFVGGKQF